MIQRIQSLYLIAVLVIVGVYFNLTIAKYPIDGSAITYRLIPEKQKENTLPIDQITDMQQVNSSINNVVAMNQSNFVNSIWAIIVNVILGILVIVTIFLYKNRVLQLRVNAFAFLANLALLGIVFWQTDIISTKLKVTTNYEIAGTLLPLVTIILLFLVNKAIRKDERMVRAADRLR